jgi:ArsR family transcriptional regulator, arsenate/arsenite/antimonite-responsive transcriptional repressor
MEIIDYASLFKSLSEPVRLRVLYLLLEKGELCVCDLVSALELSQSVVSRHLAYLRNAGLLNTRREGVWVYYQVDTNKTFINQLLSLFQEDGQQSKALKYDLERLNTVASESCSLQSNASPKRGNA